MNGAKRSNSKEGQLRKYQAWTNLPGYYENTKVTTGLFLFLALIWTLIKMFRIFWIS